MEQRRIKLGDLLPNEGQIDGLPVNPRTWTKSELENLKRSLKETPELLEARGLLVYPHNGEYVILGGNMRYAALVELKATEAPCIILPESLNIDKLKEIVIKDNGSFGEWDEELLVKEWAEMPLLEWGVETLSQTISTDVDLTGLLSIDTIAKEGESRSGCEAITFTFKKEDAQVVKQFIKQTSKDVLTEKIVCLCQNVEAR